MTKDTIVNPTMTPDMLREGIFNLNTRRFGTVAEVMVKRMVKLGKGKNLFHDLYDDVKDHRIEVKFSTVRKKNNRPIDELTVVKCIQDELGANRYVPFTDWENYEFDCNIQQIKRNEFEVLYYGLFFYDKVLIFKVDSGDIGPDIYYSDKQHKGNQGEGQFHINRATLQIHLDRYLYAEMSYEKLLELLTVS